MGGSPAHSRGLEPDELHSSTWAILSFFECCQMCDPISKVKLKNMHYQDSNQKQGGEFMKVLGIDEGGEAYRFILLQNTKQKKPRRNRQRFKLNEFQLLLI